ncbi:MAG TPA: hypothetical protein VGF30_03210, partial [Bacteroidia bacterium]
LFIFIPVIILTGNAQDTLRKRISLFGQAGYNRPLNFSTISSSPDKKQEINYYYKNGFSISAGLSHSMKKLTLSWLARYTYVSGITYHILKKKKMKPDSQLNR